MIKTDIDIKDAVYGWIAGSTLASTISGKVYKDQRPLNSTKEDIEIAVLSRFGNQTQEVAVNVNIFVPDIRRNGDMIEDTARLRTLGSLAAGLFDYRQTGGAVFELEAQQMYKVINADLHAINNRLRIRFNNE